MPDEPALPGAPEPWAASTIPAWRDGPPYAMTDMIEAEPALAERLARRMEHDPALTALAQSVAEVASRDEPIVLTGCGTSEHAAMAVGAILDEALRATGHPRRTEVADAFEVARRPPSAGMLIAVSHEGGTAATIAALRSAAAGGLRTALVTVSAGAPAAAVAEIVVTTEEQDQSWCHTVGYLSPLVVGAMLAARLREQELEPTSVRALLDISDDAPGAERMAAEFAGCDRLLVAGSGIDYVAARELALKIEEGARLSATAHHLETLLHGHLASVTEHTGLVVVLTGTDVDGATDRIAERSCDLLRAVRELGMRAGAIVGASLGDSVPIELTSAGRLAVPGTRLLPPVAASALGSAIPFQLFAERLARARGVNPDTLGREHPRQAAAAGAAETGRSR